MDETPHANNSTLLKVWQQRLLIESCPQNDVGINLVHLDTSLKVWQQSPPWTHHQTPHQERQTHP
eukprot:1141707-Pelagomonas_calceolata.AAC.3